MTGANGLVSDGPAEDAAGPRSPVLLLHATASTGGQWGALARRLAPHRAVATPDVAGWGHSRDLVSHPLSLGREAARLADAMGSANSQFHLVGHSMGGAIAMRLALTMPARIKSLTLIEPVLFHLLRDGTEADRALWQEPAMLAARMRTAARRDDLSSAAMQEFVEYWSGPGSWLALRESCRAAIAPCAGCVAENFDALEAERFSLAELGALDMPVLVLMGGASRAVTQRIAARLFDSLPAARLGIVAGAGHMMPITHVLPVNDRIVAHIETAENGGGIGAPLRPTVRAA